MRRNLTHYARLTIAGVAERPYGEPFAIQQHVSRSRTWSKNCIRRVLLLYLQTARSCLECRRSSRRQLGDIVAGSFVFGPDLKFPRAIRPSCHRIPRQIGNQYSKTGVGRERPLFSYRDGKGNAGGKAQERLRPARNILRLHFNLTTGEPLGLDKSAADPNARDRSADEWVLRIIRVRKRDIQGLDRTARSIKNRFDPSGRLALAGRADDICGNAGARLHPATEFLSGQNVANEYVFGVDAVGNCWTCPLN